MNTTQATINYLEARKALEVAEQAKAQAEAILKQTLAQNGVEFSVVDGTKVAVVKGERPNYDAEALRELVSPALFRTVTKATVDAKKFRSAIELGKIKDDVAGAVTSVTHYEQVRVTELKNEAGEAEGRNRKVA
jgi:PP-loop superfamily ATP-utilizing enzyme